MVIGAYNSHDNAEVNMFTCRAEGVKDSTNSSRYSILTINRGPILGPKRKTGFGFRYSTI